MMEIKNSKTLGYNAPTIEIVVIALEQVIAGSTAYNQSKIEHEEMSEESFANDDDFTLVL